MIAGSEEREYTISERADWSSESSREKISYLEEYPGFNWRRYVQEILALRTRDHKYVWSSEGRHELCDLENDRQETRNLITIDKAKASELGIKSEAWMGSFSREEPTHAASTDLEGPVRERLKALGYLQCVASAGSAMFPGPGHHIFAGIVRVRTVSRYG